MKIRIKAVFLLIIVAGICICTESCATNNTTNNRVVDGLTPAIGTSYGIRAESHIAAFDKPDELSILPAAPPPTHESAPPASTPGSAVSAVGPSVTSNPLESTLSAAPEAPSAPVEQAVSTLAASPADPQQPSISSSASAVPTTTNPDPARGEQQVEVVSIPVLNYHSIGIEPDNTLVLDPVKFAAQMDYLAEHGYTPLSLADFMLIMEKSIPAPAKAVLLTFDDGYADNYELAMPVLKKHGFPATLFMSPGSVGQAGYLTWDQAKEMHQAGWDIQSHGMTHPHLPRLSAAKQREEITEARRLIEEHLGIRSEVFCYPYGEFNKQTLSILEEEGFRYAFTIQQGKATSSQHPLQLKRIYVNGQDSLSAWSKKLSR